MTPEQASAQICACLESCTGSAVQSGGEAEVLAWCKGTTPSGESRGELLATREGETLFGLMLRKIRTTKTKDGTLAALGILAFRGTWDAKGIRALTLSLDSGTRLCNGLKAS